MVLAAAPEWLSDNMLTIAVVVLVVAAIVVLRMVTHAITRLVLVAILVGAGVFVTVERDDLERCTRECECELVGLQIDVPACDPVDFPGN